MAVEQQYRGGGDHGGGWRGNSSNTGKLLPCFVINKITKTPAQEPTAATRERRQSLTLTRPNIRIHVSLISIPYSLYYLPVVFAVATAATAVAIRSVSDGFLCPPVLKAEVIQSDQI